MNASPTTNPTALINSAIDLGVRITECPIGDGFIIVYGKADRVSEWMNEAPGGMYYEIGDGFANAARQVLA